MTFRTFLVIFSCSVHLINYPFSFMLSLLLAILLFGWHHRCAELCIEYVCTHCFSIFHPKWEGETKIESFYDCLVITNFELFNSVEGEYMDVTLINLINRWVFSLILCVYYPDFIVCSCVWCLSHFFWCIRELLGMRVIRCLFTMMLC